MWSCGFCDFFSSLVSFLFLITLLLPEETKPKLHLKLYRDREHIGMSHVLLEDRFHETLTDATLNSACGQMFCHDLASRRTAEEAHLDGISHVPPQISSFVSDLISILNLLFSLG
jgi:hypothetical protein